jgi:hypothetical protein
VAEVAEVVEEPAMETTAEAASEPEPASVDPEPVVDPEPEAAVDDAKGKD